MKRSLTLPSVILMALAAEMLGCTAPEETVVASDVSDEEISIRKSAG